MAGKEPKKGRRPTIDDLLKDGFSEDFVKLLETRLKKAERDLMLDEIEQQLEEFYQLGYQDARYEDDPDNWEHD